MYPIQMTVTVNDADQFAAVSAAMGLTHVNAQSAAATQTAKAAEKAKKSGSKATKTAKPAPTQPATGTEPAKQESAPESHSEVTEATLGKALKDYANSHSMDDARALLAKFNANKIPDLNPNQYGAVYSAIVGAS